MFYTFINLKHKDNTKKEITFEDLLKNPKLMYTPNYAVRNQYYHTATIEMCDAKDLEKVRLKNEKNITRYINAVLAPLSAEALALKEKYPNWKDLYKEFNIPKKSGGYRLIQAPESELMNLLKTIKYAFDFKLNCLAHDRAFAYVKQRSTKQALEIHQQYDSQWFLKLDLKDFFPSCNKEFIMQQLSKLYPFYFIMQDPIGLLCLSNIIDVCLLDNKLPQGTPMSPMITNLIMLPVDYAITKEVKGLTYTRYADDMLLSKRIKFNWAQTVIQINDILKEYNAPFKIKDEKTRFGSKAGQNWNLGLMLNKDNNITTGHKEKQRLRAAIFSFLTDLTNGNTWSKIDVQILMGHINYCKQIEPAYIEHVLQKYNEKFNKEIIQEMITIIKTA